MRTLLQIILFLIFASCSQNKSPAITKVELVPQDKPIAYVERGPMKVYVQANGRDVKDFDNKLVDYFSLTKKAVQSFQQNSKLKLETELDREKKIMGLRIREVGDNPLGLKTGDIILAVGKDKVSDPKHFEVFYEDLLRSGKETISLERRYRPRKFFYNIE
ncbi:hypothetical protein JNK13_08765 [bacterium]|nr:hypothetical protein [bacterium]